MVSCLRVFLCSSFYFGSSFHLSQVLIRSKLFIRSIFYLVQVFIWSKYLWGLSSLLQNVLVSCMRVFIWSKFSPLFKSVLVVNCSLGSGRALRPLRCCSLLLPPVTYTFLFSISRFTSDTLDFSYMLTQSSYAYQHHRLVLSLWNSLLSFLRTLRFAIFGNDFMQKLPFVVLLPILSSLSPSPQNSPRTPLLPTTNYSQKRVFGDIFHLLAIYLVWSHNKRLFFHHLLWEGFPFKLLKIYETSGNKYNFG